MPYSWGPTSIARLQTCHELLRELFARVIKRPDLPHDLTVLYGHRTHAEQAELYAKGRRGVPGEKTVTNAKPGQSKHNASPSHAVDVAPIVKGSVSWDWAAYHAVAPVIKAEWAKMTNEGLTHGVTLSWGGDWERTKDGPHWEVRGV
jgi:peptidoglycan L-alanyl-D-glutamate endopeptidase CwlK